MLHEKIKALLNYSPLLKAVAFVVDDLIWGLRLTARQVDTDCGATHAVLSKEESIHYIEEVFADYKKYGRLDEFYGVAAEIGPGDNAGVALLMRRDGCSQVDLIDRYYSRRHPENQGRIYDALAQRYELYGFREKNCWDEQALSGVTWQTGQPAEVYFRKCATEQGQVYDFIVSCAVLEHLYDPLDALRYMVACLKPGGRMFHKIDFRDHSMFTPAKPELTFLQIPSYVYRLMVQNSGRPNRVLVHRYRETLNEIKSQGLIDYSILVTHLVGVGNITPHQKLEDVDTGKQRQAIDFVQGCRRKIVDEFNDVSSEDLAISGIFLEVIRN